MTVQVKLTQGEVIIPPRLLRLYVERWQGNR
jgi:hypothetical protein